MGNRKSYVPFLSAAEPRNCPRTCLPISFVSGPMALNCPRWMSATLNKMLSLVVFRCEHLTLIYSHDQLSDPSQFTRHSHTTANPCGRDPQNNTSYQPIPRALRFARRQDDDGYGNCPSQRRSCRELDCSCEGGSCRRHAYLEV